MKHLVHDIFAEHEAWKYTKVSGTRLQYVRNWIVTCSADRREIGRRVLSIFVLVLKSPKATEQPTQLTDSEDPHRKPKAKDVAVVLRDELCRNFLEDSTVIKALLGILTSVSDANELKHLTL